MGVGTLAAFASVLVLNATGGNIRFSSWVTSTFSDARNWPFAVKRHSRRKLSVGNGQCPIGPAGIEAPSAPL
jgi:hypothetical protein